MMFVPNSIKKDLIGSLEQKKENLKLQRGLTKVNIREKKDLKTNICTLL